MPTQQQIPTAVKEGLVDLFNSREMHNQHYNIPQTESILPLVLKPDPSVNCDGKWQDFMHLQAPYEHWAEASIEEWYVAKCEQRIRENAPWDEVNSYVLNMRVLWDFFKTKFKDDRKISFTRFLKPYQKCFTLVREYAKELTPCLDPGNLVRRDWIQIYDAPRPKTLRIMSFNVLSQTLNDQFSFQFVVLHETHGDFLAWSHRKDLMVKEINRWAPDILCLQEVDMALKDQLVECIDGMEEAAYCQRHPSARDALLILYRPSERLKRLSEHEPISAALSCPPHDDVQHGGLQQRVRFNYMGQDFEMVNAHVSGMAPALEPVRALELVNRPTGDFTLPLIIAGDVNGMRDESLPAFNGMGSAYDHPCAMKNNGPVITAHNDKYHSCGELDKIMYSRPFKVNQILQIQDEERLVETRMETHPIRSMPNKDWPSDHVSIVADFFLDNHPDCVKYKYFQANIDAQWLQQASASNDEAESNSRKVVKKLVNKKLKTSQYSSTSGDYVSSGSPPRSRASEAVPGKSSTAESPEGDNEERRISRSKLNEFNMKLAVHPRMDINRGKNNIAAGGRNPRIPGKSNNWANSLAVGSNGRPKIEPLGPEQGVGKIQKPKKSKQEEGEEKEGKEEGKTKDKKTDQKPVEASDSTGADNKGESTAEDSNSVPKPEEKPKPTISKLSETKYILPIGVNKRGSGTDVNSLGLEPVAGGARASAAFANLPGVGKRTKGQSLSDSNNVDDLRTWWNVFEQKKALPKSKHSSASIANQSKTSILSNNTNKPSPKESGEKEKKEGDKERASSTKSKKDAAGKKDDDLSSGVGWGDNSSETTFKTSTDSATVEAQKETKKTKTKAKAKPKKAASKEDFKPDSRQVTAGADAPATSSDAPVKDPKTDAPAASSDAPPKTPDSRAGSSVNSKPASGIKKGWAPRTPSNADTSSIILPGSEKKDPAELWPSLGASTNSVLPSKSPKAGRTGSSVSINGKDAGGGKVSVDTAGGRETKEPRDSPNKAESPGKKKPSANTKSSAGNLDSDFGTPVQGAVSADGKSFCGFVL